MTQAQHVPGQKEIFRPKPEHLFLGAESGLNLSALAGYIDKKIGKRLKFSLVVNDVGVLSGFGPIVEVFQDGGTIAAIIRKEN